MQQFGCNKAKQNKLVEKRIMNAIEKQQITFKNSMVM